MLLVDFFMQKTEHTLSAEPRDIFGKGVVAMRSQGKIPGVVYGPGALNQHITLELRVFEKLFRAAGESSLVTLTVADTPAIKVLVHDVQTDPVTGRALHVDLYRVNMKEKLTTHISLVFTGESKAVKEQGGILVKNIDEIEVRCLPENLVPEIAVKLDSLNDLEATLTIGDLVLPSGIELLHHEPGDIIAIVMPPITEEAMKKMEQEGAAPIPAEPAPEEAKKKEE